LSYDPIRQEINLAGPAHDHQAWTMQPVKVLESRWQYLRDPRHGGEALRLEPAFWIGRIAYRQPRPEVIRATSIALLPQPFSAMPLSRFARLARRTPRSRSRLWPGYASAAT
jgi:hypothetical protein